MERSITIHMRPFSRAVLHHVQGPAAAAAEAVQPDQGRAVGGSLRTGRKRQRPGVLGIRIHRSCDNYFRDVPDPGRLSLCATLLCDRRDPWRGQRMKH